MKIIYMHHAERKINQELHNQNIKQRDDITDNGIKEALLIAEQVKKIKNIKAIYTSPYLRCRHTAEIINKFINVPIYEEERFNEKNSEELWQKFLEKNMEAINDIVVNYDDEDTIICVTSGVNFTAFVCYFYKIIPTNDTFWSQACSISPISFEIQK